MELFLQSHLVFEKLAMGTEMPEDPNQWSQAVLQEVYKQLPYLSDFSPHIAMDKVDAERGYGFGNITVTNQTEVQPGNAAAGVRQVRIPIVIKGGKLAPLDILVTDDSKVLPMTESRLRSSIFRPQAFDVTSQTPGDNSLVGTLFPPHRVGNGMGLGGGGGTTVDAAGMGKTSGVGAVEAGIAKQYGAGNYKKVTNPDGSVRGYVGGSGVHNPKMLAVAGSTMLKGASVLSAISGTLNDSDLNAFKSSLRDPDTRLAYEKNAAATLESVSTVLGERPHHKLAFSQSVQPSVLQVVKIAGGYVVKTASHRYWDPFVRVLDRGEALRELGEKVVLAADMSGAATLASGADAVGQEQQAVQDVPGPVSSSGVYTVHTDDGEELQGYVIVNLIDTDGMRMPLSLFTNGQQATVQGDILGTHISDDVPQLPSGAPQGYGAFYTYEDGGLVATVPMELKGSYAQPGEPTTMQGQTFDGRGVSVSQQPNIQAVYGAEDKMLVPQHWKWLPMDHAGEVSLRSSEDGEPKEASARRMFSSVDVVSGGSQFSIRGPLVEKLAHDQREFLDVDGAMFLLAGFGVDQTYGMGKLAESTLGNGPVNIKVGRLIHLADERTKQAHSSAAEFMRGMPALKHRLFKEAAVISDPEAVDTVLSLGFINAENISTFISYIPVLEGSQAKMCELLMAARLGLNNTPEGALERSIRATEEVLEGLKTLAFESPGVN